MSSFCGYALVLSTVLLVVAAEAPLPSYLNRQLRQQPQLRPRVNPPLTQHYRVADDSGQFALQYSSKDGTFTEEGQLKPTRDGKDLFLAKKGQYFYYSPEGVPISISYIADENGFQPQGDAIPITAAEAAKRHRQ